MRANFSVFGTEEVETDDTSSKGSTEGYPCRLEEQMDTLVDLQGVTLTNGMLQNGLTENGICHPGGVHLHMEDSSPGAVRNLVTLQVPMVSTALKSSLFLQNVRQTFTKTHSTLKRRPRLIHIFYALALPLYTVLGALLFQYLDGDIDDKLIAQYRTRCDDVRNASAQHLLQNCSTSTIEECFEQIQESLKKLSDCFHEKDDDRPPPSLPMSRFDYSVLYALSVYTTIGYGNVVAVSTACRVATVLYAIVGIPLFFAFLKDMGQLFSVIFMKAWRSAGRLRNRAFKKGGVHHHDYQHGALSPMESVGLRPSSRHRKSMKMSFTGDVHPNMSHRHMVREQRKVFAWAVGLFVVYLVICSWFLMLMETEWDFFTSFYFLFTSVALIGFGDIFPEEANVVLINFVFIVLGIILFGMCYFILQEEIREKAFQASRKVRHSVTLLRNASLLSNLKRKHDNAAAKRKAREELSNMVNSVSSPNVRQDRSSMCVSPVPLSSDVDSNSLSPTCSLKRSASESPNGPIRRDRSDTSGAGVAQGSNRAAHISIGAALGPSGAAQASIGAALGPNGAAQASIGAALDPSGAVQGSSGATEAPDPVNATDSPSKNRLQRFLDVKRAVITRRGSAPIVIPTLKVTEL